MHTTIFTALSNLKTKKNTAGSRERSRALGLTWPVAVNLPFIATVTGHGEKGDRDKGHREKGPTHVCHRLSSKTRR